ncbi:MAG: hypothetical protein J6R60_05250, partial [Clostridia bacterium]|nr:hypothetical protein [Clostridia bacterium]
MIRNKRALIVATAIYLALQGALTAVRYNSEGKVFVATSYGIVILACVFAQCHPLTRLGNIGRVRSDLSLQWRQ